MELLWKNHKRIFSFQQARKIYLILLLFVFLFDFLLFPLPIMAQQDAAAEFDNSNQDSLINQDKALGVEELNIVNHLPDNDVWQAKHSSYRLITAYNSEVAQTDASPCITASGFNLCEHGIEDTVAANFLFFGTKIRIPELFGDRVFVVRDRMRNDYNNRLDIWMIKKEAAKQFGAKIAKIEILE